MTEQTIHSVEDFIANVRRDSSSWPAYQPRWFRGEPASDRPLLPTLYREGYSEHENMLLQMFRVRAPAFYESVPDREKTDQWLFLARHVGLPTRLLDWSESALVGLHFALQEMHEAVVWMLNPLQLNYMSDLNAAGTDPDLAREFPLTWYRPADGDNIGEVNIGAAWEHDRRGVDLPVAIHPTLVHARLRSQRSCFTVQGRKKQCLNELVSGRILKCYIIAANSRNEMLRDLQILGVTDSVVFPDLDGLARELKQRCV